MMLTNPNIKDFARNMIDLQRFYFFIPSFPVNCGLNAQWETANKLAQYSVDE